jgi:hypothetical protein
MFFVKVFILWLYIAFNSLVFDLLNFIFYSKHSKILSSLFHNNSFHGFISFISFPFILLKNDISLFIHTNSLIIMYFLHHRLKLFGLFGVILINHSSGKFGDIFKYFISGAFLVKLISPLINKIDTSSLRVYVSTNFSSYQEFKLSALDVEIKQEFVNELRAYVYENSNLKKVFPFFLIFYLVFLGVILVHYCLVTCKLSEADLEAAYIKQYLIRYYEKPWLWSVQNNLEKNHQEDAEKDKKSKCDQLKALYKFFFGKNKAELAFDKIHKQCKLNQLELHTHRLV